MIFSIEDQKYMSIQYIDKKVVFDVSEYKHSGLPIDDDLFIEINEYMTHLTEKESEDVFSLYEEARWHLTNGGNSISIRKNITDIVQAIYNNILYDDMLRWFKDTCNLHYPTNCPERIENSDLPPESTYTRPEFRELSVLAIWIRPVIGIWAEYVRMAGADYGDSNKGYVTVGLMANTEMYELPPYERLKRYIEHNRHYAMFAKNPSVSVTSGLSTDELLDWATSMAMIRRVGIAPVDVDRGNPPKTKHIVSVIWTYINGMLSRNATSSMFETLRTRQKQYGEDGQERPVLDQYRPVQEETYGQMVFNSTYLSRRASVMLNIDPTIPIELIEQMAGLTPLDVTDFQVTLCQLVLSMVMSPNSVTTLVHRRLTGHSRSGEESTKNPINDAVIITKAILWHWGHKELSLLMGARSATVDVSDGQDQIPKSVMADLMLYYPYQRKQGGNDRQRNIAYMDIMELTKRIGRGTWDVVYCPTQKADVLIYLNPLERLAIPSCIPELIAALVINVARLKKEMGTTELPE